ncbi:MAG: Radical domain protein [Sedimentibacter sp.]|jgi:radical SAM superfamily enzyme YgiQ (UPF0313 family)|nr:Radical domain protein [Sedimentibacter sp.]
MKIAFIRPGMFGKKSRDAMMPLVFAIIKPLTKAPIEFYDEKIEALPENLDANVVALTVDTFSAKRAYFLAEKYKRENKIVIMGGFHPTMVPDECLQYSDAVVVGEAEDTWPMIVDDIKNNCLKKKYISQNNSDLSKVKYDYMVFNGKYYNNIALVQFGRGCRYCCDFCSINAFYKGNVRTRNVENVASDIKKIKEKYIFFVDDNIFADREKAVKLFMAMKKLRKKWACQISMDIAENAEILEIMKQSGCMMVLIGFESLNKENLKEMNKKANMKLDYEKALKNIYGAGLMVYGTFVIGYGGDTTNTAQELVDFAVKNKFVIANFNPLMAMPGTALYERLKWENKLVMDKWWLENNFRYGDSMIIPEKMTGLELKESCRDARYSFYSLGNIFKRMMKRSNVENMSVYLKTNLISRFEILFKQGRILGGRDENYAD